MHAYLLAFLDQSQIPRRRLDDKVTYRKEDAIELIDHFFDVKKPFMGSSMSQAMIQLHGITLGMQAPYLLHAMLAVAASHLKFLHPEVEKYSAAATLHYTRSLQAYSSQLVYDIERGNPMAMLAASGLLAKLSFVNTPVMLVNTPLAAQTGPTWIRSMQGVRTILSTLNLREQLQETFMVPIMLNYKDDGGKVELDLASYGVEVEALRALRELCGGVEYEQLEPNHYSKVMAKLESLMLCQPNDDWVDKYMAFIATLDPSFIDLLERNETRALLILSFWCARLSLIRQW